MEKNKDQNIRNEIRTKMLSYIVAALGLVAGLAWNDAIKALIETVFPGEKNNLTAKFGYAFLITVIIVLLSIILSRVFKQSKK